MTNDELAATLLEIANLLEKQEENPYRIRAYRRAANSLKRYSDQVSEMVEAEVDLTIIPNIGVHLAERLKQIVLTGQVEFPQGKPPKELPAHLQKKTAQTTYF